MYNADAVPPPSTGGEYTLKRTHIMWKMGVPFVARATGSPQQIGMAGDWLVEVQSGYRVIPNVAHKEDYERVDKEGV